MIKALQNETCIWDSLALEKRPVFLYGTGNGADKIINTCELYSIKIAGVFASASFVRNRFFRGMPVRALSDIEKEYGDDFVILLAFGTTLDSVIDDIRKAAVRHTLYIPEVPLYGGKLFDKKYFLNNLDAIETAYTLLSDETSKKLFYNMIKFRLTASPQCLSITSSPREMYSELIPKESIKTVLDCGAYRGDSADDIISSLAPKTLYALEPDKKTFEKLKLYAEGETRANVECLNLAIGSAVEKASFSSSGSRGSGTDGKNKRAKETTAELVSIDSLDLPELDLIKLDVEGDEVAALDGAFNTIKKYNPALSISVYHRTADIFNIPLKISQLYPDYNLYLRRAPCIPAWDITLIAVPPIYNA